MDTDKNSIEQSCLIRGLESALALRNYNKHIVTEAIKRAGSAKKIIDFGAGAGTLALIFREMIGIDPLCIEPDTLLKEHLEKKNFICCNRLDEVEETVDLIFSSNVLEHIKDDIAILSKMKEKINKDGRVYLYVPAKMFLWTQLDENVGHYRRYEIAEIKDKCKQAGLKIENIHYADSIGFFVSLYMKFSRNTEEMMHSERLLKFYDRWLFPLSKILDRLGCKYFFGKNIVLCARKSIE